MPVPEGTMALRERFRSEPLYLEVIDALAELDFGAEERERKRARHRASQYFIEGGKLWRLGGVSGGRARSRRECITKAEAKVQAAIAHANGGHFHRDHIKMVLTDRFHSPKLDDSIIAAIRECAQCKNFGSAGLHALLQPITRRHPFELIAADYMSMPKSEDGYKTTGLYIDVASQHIWGEMYRESGTGDATTQVLESIFRDYLPAETVMVDNGSHFVNKSVKATCDRWGAAFMPVAKYSPWINGLVEGANRLLVYILARMCAPHLGEDGWRSIKREELPGTWSKYFRQAIHILNSRILPAVRFSPKEILFARAVNTVPTPIMLEQTPFTADDAHRHFDYAAQQRLDAYDNRTSYSAARKAVFDRKVAASRQGEVVFTKGELVQVFDTARMKTLSTNKKIEGPWGDPHRVRRRLLNSYELETLDGVALTGLYNARRLRRFEARKGTRLEDEQNEVTKRIREQEASDGVAEASRIQKERALEEKRVEEAENELNAIEGSLATWTSPF
ncbi:Retrotransposon-like family member [Mycena kentingensis (nom. inval.)]|nr:Retrotransposon-like family member [Mycena kentingensis (nom. inval.)]